jgi:hypothetical protein
VRFTSTVRVGDPSGRRHWRVFGLLVALAAVGVFALPRDASAVSSTITNCNEAELRKDVEAGGNYTFECSGSSTIVLTSALVVKKQLSLTAPSSSTVTIDGYEPGAILKAGAVRRIFTVESGGVLELIGVHLAYGSVSAGPVSTPTKTHTDEKVGCIIKYFGYEGGECGPLAVKPTSFGEAGSTPGAPGEDGQNAPSGGSSAGGCMLIEAGASVTLVGDTFSTCSATGSSQAWLPNTGPYAAPGDEQGLGGFGGEGGLGSDGFRGANTYKDPGKPAAGPGGTGGDATAGGNGGKGSAGGAGLGGAIFDGGSLIVRETSFVANRAIGGQGGAGGNGGWGGHGGKGGHGGTEFRYESDPNGIGATYPGAEGGAGSFGGDGGDGGSGGDAEGGAILATGYLAITSAQFKSNLAQGGNGGTAGLGGGGGNGGWGGDAGGIENGGNLLAAISGGDGGPGGDGGNAGNSGKGGSAIGGAIDYVSGSTGSLPDASTFAGDSTIAGAVCAGLTATPVNCDTTGGLGGEGGLGGRRTPCKELQTECPYEPSGASGGSGASGVIGIAGITEGGDTAGAPGSGAPPPAGGGAGGSSTGSTGSGTGGSSGGTPATPHAGATSATGTSVATTVSCSGSAGQACTVTAAITVQETTRGSRLIAVTAKAKHPSLRHTTVTLGSITATIPAGTSRKLTVKLSAAGAKLLKTRHVLPVRFSVSQTGASAAAAGTHTIPLEQTNLTLHAAHAKHKH